jgi:hypothetical protein
MNAIKTRPISPIARLLSALVALFAAAGATWFWLAVASGGWDWGAGAGAVLMTLITLDFGVVAAVLGEWPLTAFFAVP